jgi:hypothetical protein
VEERHECDVSNVATCFAFPFHLRPRSETPMESTLSFPSVSRPASVALVSGSELSTVSAHQATALQVCDLVYGEAADAPDWEAVEGLYEANASKL